MIAHEHDGESMTPLQMAQHLLTNHPEMPTPDRSALFEEHMNDHARAMREAIALAGHRVPANLTVEGMPEYATTALAPPDTGAPIRGVVEALLRDRGYTPEQISMATSGIPQPEPLRGDDVAPTPSLPAAPQEQPHFSLTAEQWARAVTAVEMLAEVFLP